MGVDRTGMEWSTLTERVLDMEKKRVREEMKYSWETGIGNRHAEGEGSCRERMG